MESLKCVQKSAVKQIPWPKSDVIKKRCMYGVSTTVNSCCPENILDSSLTRGAPLARKRSAAYAVSNDFPCFSVSERVLWVLFEVLCGFPDFHCHLPTVLVPVLSITFSDDTHTMRFGMFWKLEIFMEVLCA